MIQNITKKQLPQIIFLRGLAALMVCFFHLFCGNVNLFPTTNFLKHIFSYGYLGVPVFFMISGFIICYSLPVNYKLAQSKTFFLKRIIRIEPPYIASILLVILLNYVGSFYSHVPLQFSWVDFFCHFAYLNNFGIGTYYNVVYWTLGIEFQFYILIGLLFSLVSRSKTSLIVFMVALLFATFIHVNNMQLIFQYLSIFGIGILTYFYQFKKQVNKPVYIAFCILFLVQIYIYQHLDVFCASAFTLLVLNTWNYNHGVLDFFSNISFSLYLTHTIIGGKVINLGLRFAHSTGERYLLFLAALGASIVFAYIFYRVIERPFIVMGKRLAYNTNTKL